MQPDALLLVAPGCPHCPGVLDALGALVKEGVIGRLEVINVAVHPERAAALGVRGVPFTRLGPFELDGARTAAELRRWAERAAHPRGMAEYLEQMLAEGGLAKVEAMLAAEPARFPQLLGLMEDAELPLQVRLGIGAVIEGLAGTPVLQEAVPVLARLTGHADHRVRGDACHFLGLTLSPAARPALEACLGDPHPEVREIAREALEGIAG
ncbi:MAG: HEAT repeat domain-containing protein [Thiohalomonadaceae bacterium]